MNDTRSITVEIQNVTEAQIIALEDMFAKWVLFGRLGCSRWTAFFADGDGNFRPNIKVNGETPKHQDLFPKDHFLKHIKVLQEPTVSNGLKEAQWNTQSEVYMMDFDTIAWRLKYED